MYFSVPSQQCWIISNSRQLSWAPADQSWGRGRGLTISEARYWDPVHTASFPPTSLQCPLHTTPENVGEKKRLSNSSCQEKLPQGVEWLPPGGLSILSNESVWENNLKSYSLQDWKHLGFPAFCSGAENGTLTILKLNYKQPEGPKTHARLPLILFYSTRRLPGFYTLL